MQCNALIFLSKWVQCVDFCVTFNVSFNVSSNVSSEAIRGKVSCEVARGDVSQYIDFSPKWGQNRKKNKYIEIQILCQALY